MRTFIAAPLSPDAQNMLHKLQQPLRASGADVRWTAVESVHVTLKFLGETEPALLPRLTQSLQDIAAFHASFTLHLRGLGGFPDLRSPRVIWCGVQGDTERLQALQQDIEKACAEMGFPPDDRRFHPHLTLGRVRGKRNLHRLLNCIRIGSDLESSIEVRQVNIYKSTLTPRGPIYDVLEVIMLHG